MKNILPEQTKLTIYNSLFRSHLDYCCIAWGSANNRLISQLQALQKRALRYIANTKINAHVNPIFLRFKLLNFKDTVYLNLGITMYQYNNNILPRSFENFLKNSRTMKETNVIEQTLLDGMV